MWILLRLLIFYLLVAYFCSLLWAGVGGKFGVWVAAERLSAACPRAVDLAWIAPVFLSDVRLRVRVFVSAIVRF